MAGRVKCGCLGLCLDARLDAELEERARRRQPDGLVRVVARRLEEQQVVCNVTASTSHRCFVMMKIFS